MEMVTAMPDNANAWLIMSMPKTAHIMDVSTKANLCVSFLLLNECNNTYQIAEPS